MAAVTAPENTTTRHPGLGLRASDGGRRRAVWAGVLTVWLLVVGGLAVWSARHDPATVPDQRDIVAAIPDLQRATATVFAAADGDGRAVLLGPLEFVDGECRLTPVRHGLAAARKITVYVRTDDASAALDAIAARLPPRYRAESAQTRAGNRLWLHADAGNFVSVDSDAGTGDRSLTVRLSTGCRPSGDGEPNQADPAPGPPPETLRRVLAALGAPDSAPATEAVTCPTGAVAASYTVDDVAMPADLSGTMRAVARAGTPVRGDDTAWAYRVGGASVVVVPDDNRLRVAVSIGC